MTAAHTMLSQSHIYSSAPASKLHVSSPSSSSSSSSSASQHYQHYQSQLQQNFCQPALSPIVASDPLLDEDLDLQLHELDCYDEYLQHLQAQQASSFPQQLSASQLQSQSLSLPYYSYAPSSPAGAASSTYSSPIYSAQNSPTSDFCSFYRGDGDVSMTEGNFSPHIQLHQPSPPFGDQNSFDPETTSMLLQQGGVSSSINNYSQPSPGKLNQNGLNAATPQRQPGLHSRNTRHRKALSGSSGVSSGPSAGPLSPPDQPLSPFSPSRWNSRSGVDASSQKSSTPSSSSLPTPNQTPILNFPGDSLKSYDSSARDGNSKTAGFAMTQGMDQQGREQQGLGDEPYPLAPPSMSTQSHDSPLTPHVAYSEADDALKAMPHGEDRFLDIDRWMDDYLRFDGDLLDLGEQASQMTVPKLDRTISDIFQDELYQPTQPAQPHATPGQNPGVTSSPYHNLMADRLRAAHQGHVSGQSHSPIAADNRQPSPFRQGSPYANTPTYQPSHFQQRSRLNQPFQMGGQQQPQPQPQQHTGLGGMGLMQGEQGQETISPKQAMLDYHPSPDESNTPLFPPQQQQQQSQQQQQTPFSIASSSGFHQTPGFSAMDQFSSHHGLPNFGYMQQPQQQFPLQQQSQASQRRTAADLINQTPHFPPPMPTMESTNSEGNTAGGMISPTTQRQQPTASRPGQPITRPTDTSSRSGTYSCTYRNCSRRFETQMELQRHKRDDHRGQGIGGTDPSAPGALVGAQNSQAGPHRCMRIDPATNKPCNVVFSRPYDLTRHEDTKHNAAKQKVRCHFCSEEKTFSRNDALTRHMRVVHPEIDWPGKQKPKRK